MNGAVPRTVCTYCGAEGVKLETEHVFPESWYPDAFPTERMITVPACTPCNRTYGQLEGRLFLPLVLTLPPGSQNEDDH